MSAITIEAFERRRAPRQVRGVSAVLLPFNSAGKMDEAGFRRHLRRTLDSGLAAAVNMDTGYIDLLSAEEKARVLIWTSEICKGRGDFFAGALPTDAGGSAGVVYARECERIVKYGGVPVIFPSAATAALEEDALIGFFREIAAAAPRFLAFELGAMFNPSGRMFSEWVLAALMGMPECLGLKHSSLDRKTELARLAMRDRLRPDFVIYSGNDLAADMIEYGSDYLLGLSTFAPELFAARDRAWAESLPEYYELRDWIQYLGWLGFHPPVPAYKHSAAIFLKLAGCLDCDEPHPRAPRRDEWDRKALADAAARMKPLFNRLGIGR